MMNKHDAVSVTPHNTAGTRNVVPKKGHFAGKFNHAAGRALNKAIGVAEAFAGWGILAIGLPGTVVLMAVSLPVGMVALPAAVLIGSALAGNGMNRIHGNTGSRRARAGKPSVSNKPIGGGMRSRFVPAQEETPKRQEWYDKPQKQASQPDSGGSWQAGDAIDPGRPNGTPWGHPGMPGPGF